VLQNIKKWISDENELTNQKKKYEIGNVLEIDGKYESKYTSISIINEKLLRSNEFDINDFLELPNINKQELIQDLEDTISYIKNNLLQKLLENIFNDKDIRIRYIECPSSVKKHHAYKHGNLRHTISMVNLFKNLEIFYNRNTNLDVDLIYTGILLHDIGKIYEYTIYNGVPKVIPGSKLYGHLVLGIQLVSGFMNKIENFPIDYKNRIRHLILSHHGKREWGSLVEPQIPEAEFLHFLDMVDSRFSLNQ